LTLFYIQLGELMLCLKLFPLLRQLSAKETTETSVGLVKVSVIYTKSVFRNIDLILTSEWVYIWKSSIGEINFVMRVRNFPANVHYWVHFVLFLV